MAENKSWFAKYWKDLLKVIAAVVTVFFAVMGWQFTEEADTPFWWNTWVILALVCGFGWVVFFIVLWTGQKKKK